MNTLYTAPASVKPVPAVVVLFDSRQTRNLIPRAFGRGVIITRPATVEEARARYLETTISAEEHNARLVAAAMADEDAMLAAMARDYDPTDYPTEGAEAEAAELDKLRMMAPIVTESDFARPARSTRGRKVETLHTRKVDARRRLAVA